MKVRALYFSNKKSLNLNIELFIVGFISVFAIMTGTAVAYFSNTGENIIRLFLSFVFESANNSYIKIFLIIFSEHIIYLITCLICGTSLYGKIPIIFITFFNITGISSIITVLIKNYFLKGLEYCLLVFFPGKIILIFTLIFTSVSCIKASEDINKINKKEESAEFSDKLYLKRVTLSCIMLVISALIDSLTLKLFLPLFDFQ